jgi:hypothetical protein
MASTREVCPPPTASVCAAAREHDAFDLTCFTTFQPKRSAASSAVRRLTLRHDLRLIELPARPIGVLHEEPARDAAHRRRASGHAVGMPVDEASVLLLLEQLERVRLEPGGDQHFREELVDLPREVECPRLRADDDAAEGRLGIRRERALPGDDRVGPEPTPHGVLCFRIAIVASARPRNSSASAIAASMSTTLLYESSFPWSGSATGRKSP